MSGWAGAGNVGDELLTRAVVAVLRSQGAEAVVASRDPEATTRLHGLDAVPWGRRGRTHLDRIDGVCLGPGGILQDSSSLWSLPSHLAVPLRARRVGIPVAAVGVGAEPLRRSSSGWMLRRALAGREVVTRDAASSAALAAVGVDAHTGADLVFGLDLDLARPGSERPEIVVSVGGSVRPGLVAPASRRIEPAPAAEIAAALDRLAAALDATVVLTRFRGERDAAAAGELAERLEAEAVVLPADVDEHVRRVAGARLVVSSRYHPVVLAARAGVPAVVVSDQAKVASLVQQLDRPGIIRVGSWTDAGGIRPGPAEADVRLPVAISDGVTRAHDALAALVASARAARGG